MTLARRLKVLETRRPSKPVVKTVAEKRAMWQRVLQYQGAVVAHYLGGWVPGADAFGCLVAGERNGRSEGCTPSLTYAVMRAEWKYRGRYECLREAFEAIGPDRATLYAELQAAFDRVHELGDPVLNRIADELADSPSAIVAAGSAKMRGSEAGHLDRPTNNPTETNPELAA